jgi:hypothetical protein
VKLHPSTSRHISRPSAIDASTSDEDDGVSQSRSSHNTMSTVDSVARRQAPVQGAGVHVDEPVAQGDVDEPDRWLQQGHEDPRTIRTSRRCTIQLRVVISEW